MSLTQATRYCQVSLLVLLLCVATYSQQPDSWRGLVIDLATPEQAIALLGPPFSDKLDDIRTYHVEGMLTKDIRKKIFRELTYKNIEGVDKIVLSFRDGKLVVIDIDTKKLSPNVLEKAYGIPFQPSFSKIDKSWSPNNYERDAGSSHAKKYPIYYYLLAQSPKTILLAAVDNSSLGSILGVKAVNDDVTFPGKVDKFQIISRTLENRDNIDQLK